MIWKILLAIVAVWWLYKPVLSSRETPFHWKGLVFLCRLAFVLIIIYLLTNPQITKDEEWKIPPKVGIILDDSASMMIADEGPGKVEPRGKFIKDILWNPQGGIIKKIKDNEWEVQILAGSSGDNIREATDYHFNKSYTLFNGSLDRVSQNRFDHIYLISDGHWNNSKFPTSLSSPIHFIGIGSMDAKMDIGIKKIEFPKVVFTEEPAKGWVTLTKQNILNSEDLKLTLKKNGKTIETYPVEFPKESNSVKVEVNLEFENEGDHEINFSLTKLEEDLFEENNNSTHIVKAVSAKIPVMLISGPPNLELQWLARSLGKDPHIDFIWAIHLPQVGWNLKTLEPEKEKIKKIPDLIPYLETPKQIWISPGFQESNKLILELEKRVSQAGINIVILPGTKPISSGLAKMEPVVRKQGVSYKKGNFPVIPGQDGKEFWQGYLSEQSHPPLPLNSKMELGRLKPLSKVLLMTDKIDPLIVSHNYGAGKVLSIGMGSLWQWGMRKKVDDENKVFFWPYLSRSISSDFAFEKPTVQIPNHNWKKGNSSKIKLQLPSLGFNNNTPSLFLSLEDPSSRRYGVTLSQDPLTPSTYSANWQALEPGKYSWELKMGLEEYSGSFILQANSMETQALSCNKEVLALAAKNTEGLFLHISEFQKQIEKLNLEFTSEKGKRNIPLQNLPIILFLLLFLLISEWAIKQHCNLT